MVEGTAQLATVIFGFADGGGWGAPGTNVLDSGAHFYDVYEASDGGYMAVGAIEPQFYAALLDLLALHADDFPQWDRERWPEFSARFAEASPLVPGPSGLLTACTRTLASPRSSP